MIDPRLRTLAVALRLGLLLGALVLTALAAGDAAAPGPFLIRSGLAGAPLGVLLGVAALVQLVALGLAIRERRRPGPDVATPLRLAFEAAVGTTAVVVAFVRGPFAVESVRIALALGGGLWAAALVVLAAGGGRLARPLALAEIAIFNLALFLVLAETGLRIADRVRPSALLARDDATAEELVRRRRHENPEGRLRFGFPLGPGSVYDEPPPTAGERPLVVQIGDSFSYGVVPHAYHYTTVAERALDGGVAVHNLGLPGTGPLEYLHLLETEGLPLRPAAFVVAFFVGNDLAETARRDAGNRLLRLLFDRRRALLYRVPGRVATLWRESRARPDASPAEVVGERGGTEPASPEELLRAYPWLVDPRLERPTFSLARFLEIETERAVAACRPGADYGPALDVLLEMSRRAAPAPLLVTLVPDEFQVDDELWAEVRARTARALERDLPQRRLTAALRAAGVPVLDLLPRFRAECAPERGDAHCYHRLDTHWNARGNRVAGEALAAALAELLRT